jgi:hypothetical protein
MQKADKSGRPWYGLVPTLVIGGGLAYLNVSYGKPPTPYIKPISVLTPRQAAPKSSAGSPISPHSSPYLDGA